MNTTITTYKELLQARKDKKANIEKIENGFEIAKSIGQSNLTKDLLNFISDKLLKIKSQKENIEIMQFEQEYKEEYEKLEKLKKHKRKKLRIF